MKVRYRMIFAMVLAITLVWPALGRGGAPQTIALLTAPWGVPPDQALLKSFENRSGITVQIISAPSAEMYTKVQVASAGRRAPADVIFLTEEAPSFIVAPGYTEPLDARVAKSADLNAGDIERMDFWTVGGQIQGITTYVQMVMMDYNAKRLRAARLNTPAATWDELRRQSVALNQKSVDQYPVAFGAVDWSWFLMSLSAGDPMVDGRLNAGFSNSASSGR